MSLHAHSIYRSLTQRAFIHASPQEHSWSAPLRHALSTTSRELESKTQTLAGYITPRSWSTHQQRRRKSLLPVNFGETNVTPFNRTVWALAGWDVNKPHIRVPDPNRVRPPRHSQRGSKASAVALPSGKPERAGDSGASTAPRSRSNSNSQPPDQPASVHRRDPSPDPFPRAQDLQGKENDKQIAAEQNAEEQNTDAETKSEDKDDTDNDNESVASVSSTKKKGKKRGKRAKPLSSLEKYRQSQAEKKPTTNKRRFGKKKSKQSQASTRVLGPVWHATLPYTAQSKGEMSVREGQRLQQLLSGEDPGDGWVRLVSSSGQEGIVPLIHLEHRGLVSKWAYTPREEGELAVGEGETVDQLPEPEGFEDGWVLVRSRDGSDKQGLVPRSYFESNTQDDEDGVKAQELLSVQKKCVGKTKGKLSLAVGDVVALVKPEKFSAKYRVTVRSLVTGEIGEVPGANVSPLTLTAIAPFPARDGSELTLKLGDVVQAYLMSNEGLQLYGEEQTPTIGAGWLRGRRQSGECGLVPWSFLESETALRKQKKAINKPKPTAKKKNAAPPKHKLELKIAAALKVEQ